MSNIEKFRKDSGEPVHSIRLPPYMWSWLIERAGHGKVSAFIKKLIQVRIEEEQA